MYIYLNVTNIWVYYSFYFVLMFKDCSDFQAGWVIQ